MALKLIEHFLVVERIRREKEEGDNSHRVQEIEDYIMRLNYVITVLSRSKEQVMFLKQRIKDIQKGKANEKA